MLLLLRTSKKTVGLLLLQKIFILIQHLLFEKNIWPLFMYKGKVNKCFIFPVYYFRLPETLPLQVSCLIQTPHILVSYQEEYALQTTVWCNQS